MWSSACMPAIAELLCPTWTEGRHASRIPAGRVAHRHSCSTVSRRARIICLALSQSEGLPTCVYIHRLAMPRARHIGGTWTKTPDRAGVRTGSCLPPHQNLNFDRSLSQTEIIGRFILTTAMPTVNMETQLSLIMPYNSAALRNLKYEAEIRQKKRTPSSLQHTVP